MHKPSFTKHTPPDLTVIVKRYPHLVTGEMDPMWTVNTLIWTDDWSKDNGYFAEDAETGYYSDGGPQLWAEETTNAIIEHALAEGWQEMEIDWTDLDEDLGRLLQACSPIEFHAGLFARNPEMTSRIRVLFKHDSQEGAQ